MQRLPHRIGDEPREVLVTQIDRFLQPSESLVSISFHCISRSEPIRNVMIGSRNLFHPLGQLSARRFMLSEGTQRLSEERANSIDLRVVDQHILQQLRSSSWIAAK